MTRHEVAAARERIAKTLVMIRGFRRHPSSPHAIADFTLDRWIEDLDAALAILGDAEQPRGVGQEQQQSGREAPDRATLLRWAEWMRANPWRGMMARVRETESWWHPADFLEAVARELNSDDFENARKLAAARTAPHEQPAVPAPSAPSDLSVEPVAWMVERGTERFAIHSRHYAEGLGREGYALTPLYTRPVPPAARERKGACPTCGLDDAEHVFHECQHREPSE